MWFHLCTVWQAINQVMLLHSQASFLTLPTVPSPDSAAARGSQNTENTGGASVKSTAIFVGTVVPIGGPLGASIDTTLRSGHGKDARKDPPGSVSALSENVVSNIHSHFMALFSFSYRQLQPREWTLSLSLIEHVAEIPNGLGYHAANAASVMKGYYVSGYNSLVDSIAAAKSAMMLALIDWNMHLDQIAASERWGDTLPQPVHTLSNVESIPETGLLPGRQTELALRQEESLWAYAGSTAQRTTLVLGRVAQREVRKWDVVGTTTVWVARIGQSAWDGLVIVAVVPMALLAVLVLLGLAWVLKWWWRAAVWLWQRI